MKYGKLLISKKELPIIRELLAKPIAMRDVHYAKSLTKLSQELEQADALEEAMMPLNIIRLNSIITISTSQSANKTFQLVMPGKSDIALNMLSILTPMGLALYGYAEGDQVVWEFPSGINTIKIIKVEQVQLVSEGMENHNI